MLRGKSFGEGRTCTHWYNPKTRGAEDAPAPAADEEARDVLRGHSNSGAFLAEYDELRGRGMGAEQALIFVGHEFRLRHLRHRPIG